MTIESLDLETLIHLLEEGGRSEGRGIRVTSYSELFKAKEARQEIISQLKRLQDILDGDYLGDDQ